MEQGSSIVFSAKDIAELVGAPFDRVGVKPESLQKAVREGLNALVVKGQVKRLGAQGYQTVSEEHSTLH